MRYTNSHSWECLCCTTCSLTTLGHTNLSLKSKAGISATSYNQTVCVSSHITILVSRRRRSLKAPRSNPVTKCLLPKFPHAEDFVPRSVLPII